MPSCKTTYRCRREGSCEGFIFRTHARKPNSSALLQGEVYDVAVDIRVGSPNFGKWVGVHLTGENKRQLYVPRGFAHGFCVTSESALFMYKCSDFYDPESEAGLAWNDPDLGIDWPVDRPSLSGKDAQFGRLKDLDSSPLTGVPAIGVTATRALRRPPRFRPPALRGRRGTPRRRARSGSLEPRFCRSGSSRARAARRKL